MTETCFASLEGTTRFRDRFKDRAVAGHFRKQQDLWMSSIGLGTYLGGDDDETDRSYEAAVVRAVDMGTNVIDTAINYRFQRSERAVGRALRRLYEGGQIRRDELIIATKGGFIPFESHAPSSQEEMQAYFERHFQKPGILSSDDVVAGCHSLRPSFLQHQLDLSLTNLGLSGVDIYYLHNPETQLSEISRQEFYKRMLEAFELLEQNVASGKIRLYGTATWNAYRVASTSQEYLSISEMVELARTVGGEHHHFKVIQLPVNLAMPEAFGFWNQRVGEKQTSVLQAASDLGLTVVASASILQAQLAKNLPMEMVDVLGEALSSDAQRSIQFTRSTPGVSVALVGMGRVSHVEENLQLASVSPLPLERYRKLFKAP